MVSAPSSIFQNLCMSFLFLRSRLGWPFLLDLVLLVRFVFTLPDLNDLFLLEGRTMSSITISYSILFRSAPGSASPARRSGARRSGARRGGGEREAEGKHEAEGKLLCLCERENKRGVQSRKVGRGRCEQREKRVVCRRAQNRRVRKVSAARWENKKAVRRKQKAACMQVGKMEGRADCVFAKLASGRCMPINIYACRSAFFPGRLSWLSVHKIGERPS
jgi:hypothetical protein